MCFTTYSKINYGRAKCNKTNRIKISYRSMTKSADNK